MSSSDPALVPADADRRRRVAAAIDGSAHGGPLIDTPRAGPRALRGGLLRTLSYVLGIGLSLASVPLLIRHLGFAGYGRYLTVIALTTIVAALTEGGLNAIALREYATASGADRQRLMRDALGLRLLLSSLGGVGAVGFAAAAGYGSSLVIGTALASVGLVAQLVQSLLATPLQAELRFGWASLVDLLRQVVNVALLIGLILLGAGIVPLLAVAVPASLVSLLATVVLVRHQMPLRPAFHVGRWLPLVRDSIPWAAVAALNVVYFRVAIVLMSLTATALETGYFATSFRIIEVLIGVPALTVGAAYPILARSVERDARRFENAAGRMFELSLVVGTWMVICVEVVAPFAIQVIAGKGGDPAVSVLRIQAPAILGTFVGVACGYPLLTLRRFREPLVANGVALGLSAVLTLALVGPLGARGGAIAAVVAEVAMGVITAVLLRRVVPGVPIRLVAVGSIALAGAAGGGIGLLAPVHPVFGAVVATAIYVVLLRLLGRFPPEVHELLGRRRRRAGAAR